ncbi:MAG: reverse transcriptase domain-containing protein, partial [bacterium]
MKHKARLCADGGMQIEGEHFWETYSPVVQMTTVRLLLTFSLLLSLNSRSVDFTLAFTQAPIDVETYIRLPIGFVVENTTDKY